MNKTGILFLQGAGLSPQIWQGAEALIALPSLTVEYPGTRVSAKERNQLTLQDYVNTVMQRVQAWPVEGIIIVAHSIGGVLGLAVAKELGVRLKGFVAVSAVIPEHGGSYISALPLPNRLIMSAVMRIAGTKPPESAIRSSLCNGLSEEQIQEVLAHASAESKHLYFDKTNADAPNVPRLYVRLSLDKELPLSMQNTMARNLGAKELVDISFGHMPMLGKPKELAAVINSFVKTTA